MTLKALEDFPLYHKALIYGEAGSGKSTLAASFPKPMAYFDFDKGGTNSLRKLKIPENQLRVARPNTMAEFESDLVKVVKNDSGMETIVIDTANSLQARQLAEWMLENAKNRDKDIPYQGDFRKSTQMLYRFFLLLQDAQKHVVILCQERKIWDATDQSKPPRLVQIRPDLTTRLAELTGQVVDNALYLKKSPGIGTRPTSRSLILNPVGVTFAKNRLGIEKNEIPNPTYESVFVKLGE